MGRLVVAAFLSIDGVMQAPGAPDEDPDGNFPFGGWLVPFADEVMGQVVTAAIAEPDAFLLGRRTYEIFAGHWPKVTDPADPVATALNAKPKYVASRTLSSVDWSNSHLLEGDVVEAVRRLKSEIAGVIMTQGSSDLIQTLMGADLVDEYRLWFFPVVLGQGKRLFGSGTAPTRLKLTDSVTTSTGTLVNTYTAEGRPEVGSFALE
jgi:dihydrofolate reductase